MASDPLEEADRLLIKIADCAGKKDKYDDFLKALVIEARQLGIAWASIGESCGVSHQAVQQRFGKLVET